MVKYAPINSTHEVHKSGLKQYPHILYVRCFQDWKNKLNATGLNTARNIRADIMQLAQLLTDA